MEGKFQLLEDLYINVIFVGKNIEFMIKKLDCAKIVGIILFPKLLIVLILREI